MNEQIKPTHVNTWKCVVGIDIKGEYVGVSCHSLGTMRVHFDLLSTGTVCSCEYKVLTDERPTTVPFTASIFQITKCYL
jgi:hypothetical protein